MSIDQKKINRYFLDNKCNAIKTTGAKYPEYNISITKGKGWYNINTKGTILKVIPYKEFIKQLGFEE